MDKPFFMPNVPSFLLKVALGEQASMVLGGNRVSSKKIMDTGFSFKFENLDDALYNVIKLKVA
jgi:NAD dependent epimerase/dehydratase family enzyme